MNIEELLNDHGNLLDTFTYLLLDELPRKECLESTEHYALIDFIATLRDCADKLEQFT